MAMSRIEIELRHHGGRDNGKLPVTFQDFVDYGIHKDGVAPALRELEAVGIIRIQHGRAGNAEYRTPNLFFLTFANERDGKKDPPPHDWRKIETIEQAEEFVRKARAAKNLRAVERGRKQAKRRLVKKNATPGFRQVSLPETGGKTESLTPENWEDRATPETVGTIDISGGDARVCVAPRTLDPAASHRWTWTTPTLTPMPYTADLRRLYAATDQVAA
jgi:hypothetical protein